MAVEYTLVLIVRRFQQWRNISPYTYLEWQTNDTLQLQRLAHEELGYGTWSRAIAGNPVTAAGEKLSVLDISDNSHPVLVRPRAMRKVDTSPTAAEKLDLTDSAIITLTDTSSPTSRTDLKIIKSVSTLVNDNEPQDLVDSTGPTSGCNRSEALPANAVGESRQDK